MGSSSRTCHVFYDNAVSGTRRICDQEHVRGKELWVITFDVFRYE